MFNRSAIGWLALAVTALASQVLRADDTLWVGSWNLKALDTRYVDLLQYGELHASDAAPDPVQYQLTGRVAVDPWKQLGFVLGYSFLSRQNHHRAPDDWVDVTTHRLEVEVNPRWELDNGIRLSLRNRFEERWVEDRPGTYPRSRHRLELTVPVKHAAPISEVFTFFEPFFDWRTGENSENRIAPLGVTFRVSPRLSLRTYYVWQNVQAASGWSNNHMFWTQWGLSLR